MNRLLNKVWGYFAILLLFAAAPLFAAIALAVIMRAVGGPSSLGVLLFFVLMVGWLCLLTSRPPRHSRFLEKVRGFTDWEPFG